MNDRQTAPPPAGADRLIRALRSEIELALADYDRRLRYRHKAARRGGYRPEWLPTAA